MISSYLLGNDPPTFDILSWNNDRTGMTASWRRRIRWSRRVR